MVNNKSAFWQAFIFTVIVFILGLALGFFLENSRASSVEFNVMKSEINLLDEQIRNKMITESNISCTLAVNSTFNFADKIYYEAVKLEKYDSASKFTETLIEIHKRYDLLRMLLFDEATHLKKNCKSDFHTVLYLFNYSSDDVQLRAEQAIFSRLLEDLKAKHKSDVLLIPVAANLNLDSVNLAMNNYNVTRAPTIIIDGRVKISELVNIDELENMVFDSNKQ